MTRRSLALVLVAGAVLSLSASAAMQTGQWASMSLALNPRQRLGTVGLAIDPGPPLTVYGANATSVYRTTDGGVHWSTHYVAAGMRTIAVDSRGVVYAGTGGANLYKSSDHGTAWVPTSTGLPKKSDVRAIGIAPSDPQTLYVAPFGRGAYRSRDGGASWTPANGGALPALGISSLAVDPRQPNVVFAGTARGLFKTVDGGTTWSPSANGITASNVPAVAIDPSNPSIVYAGSLGRGVFKSRNGGATWSPATSGLPRPYAFVLAIDPAAPATIYAAYGRGIARSTDGGASWTDISTGAPKDNQDTQAIAVPGSGGRAYAASWNQGVLYYPAPLEGVVFRGWVSATAAGPPVRALPKEGPAMWAHFLFAAVPVHGPTMITFLGPKSKVARLARARARLVSVSFMLKPHQVFRPGRWRIVLSVGSTVLHELDVTVLP